MQAFAGNFRYWLIGTGTIEYQRTLAISNSMHNATQQVLICYGIPGCVIFLYLMLAPVLRLGKKRMLYWLPFIGAIVFVQSIQFILPCTLMLQYIPAFFALKLGADKFEN